MGQQCMSNSSAQQFELQKKGSIKIQGTDQSINKSNYHKQKLSKSSIGSKFKKSNISKLHPYIQRVITSLGNFKPSDKFKTPLGTVQPGCYILNDEGLLYRQNSEWKNDLPHGRGQLIYPDGSYYVGYFFNGIPHGQGRFISMNKWHYQGQLYNQQAEGHGKFVSQQSAITYQGQWAGDLPNGFGKQIWTNKNNSKTTYEGHFLNGIKNGNGKYLTQDYLYEGRFQNNIMNGKGRIVYKNGQSYEGNFLNGKKHGHGVYKWPDNSFYEGLYFDDKKNGIGKYTTSDGKIFQGQWKYSKRQGPGSITSGNKKINFEWRNDQPSQTKRNI